MGQTQRRLLRKKYVLIASRAKTGRKATQLAKEAQTGSFSFLMVHSLSATKIAALKCGKKRERQRVEHSAVLAVQYIDEPSLTDWILTLKCIYF